MNESSLKPYSPSIPASMLFDGKAGHHSLGLGVLEALGCKTPAVILIHDGKGYLSRLRNDINLRNKFSSRSDLILGCGKSTAKYIKYIKQKYGKKIFTIFLNDPGEYYEFFDFIWTPAHDRVSIPNGLSTLTVPHRITMESLMRERRLREGLVSHLPEPRIAVLLGGPSAATCFSREEGQRLCHFIERLGSEYGASFLLTGSRRTPAHLFESLSNCVGRFPHWCWNGIGENPYLTFLAMANGIVVTADSVNMVSEALAVNCPVYVFRPSDLQGKFSWFLDQLLSQELVSIFDGSFTPGKRTPVNATPLIAGELLRRITDFEIAPFSKQA